MEPEDKQALVQEIVPRTLHSLFVLRITLYIAAGCLALIKVLFSPPAADFILSIVTDPNTDHDKLNNLVRALNVMFSGLLAAVIAVIIATYFIQGRIRGHADQQTVDPATGPAPSRGLARIFKTLRGEGFVALLTGLITFGTIELLVPHTPTTGAAFGLVAAVAAGALDTLYFHLLYRLREAPVHMAEKRHTHSLEDARGRLAEGSIRLREALIRRFEADYQRTVATARVDSRRSRRQLRAARQWLHARLWVTDHVIPGDQFAAANHEAKTNPAILEVWTDQVDALVDARIEVLRRESFVTNLLNRFRPAYSARRTLEEWRTFAGNS